jgi:hypothetical protein
MFFNFTRRGLMDRKTQWLSLIAGIMLFLYSIKRLVQGGEWVLLIISILILAFTISSMLRSRQQE